VTDQAAIPKIEQHTLWNIDNDSIAEAIRNDVAIVDEKRLADLWNRAR
jgi:hypothetical protein